MTKNELIAELSAVPEACWIVSSYPNQAGAVMWLPLMKISATGIWLGLDRNGVWTLGRLHGVAEPSAEGLPSSWATILDSDESSLRTGLASAAERFGLSPGGLQKLVPDELWELAASLLPSFAARPPDGGTVPCDDRAVFTAVV
ncbi:hypothetical protein [Streptomyces syringium]|uniref:hypothetical protein n=1 Tax=Streptomyces syringium TaxID=76729 RepID=UPI003424430F